MANYFTTKVADKQTFCNREEERKTLLNHIDKGRHTVITAPRRYGKTSLVCNALSQHNKPFARIDLFCVVYEEDICNKVAKGISELISQIATFSEKTIKILEKCFKSAYVGFRAGHFEVRVGFEKTAINPISQFEDLLLGLELLAKKNKKPVVLFFDEFQDVLKVGETHRIQAIIRDVAQHSHYVTYIFSGSSRRMLTEIFEDKNQPLYMLCRKIILGRIKPEYFVRHIQRSAKKQWGKLLHEECVNNILSLTECHTYYVNMLCDVLWDLDDQPTLESILPAWDHCMLENKGKIVADLERLNPNRAKVLLMVGLMRCVNEPNGKEFINKTKLPLGTVQKSTKYLLDNDYIHETDSGLQCVDPLMQKFIVEHIYGG